MYSKLLSILFLLISLAFCIPAGMQAQTSATDATTQNQPTPAAPPPASAGLTGHSGNDSDDKSFTVTFTSKTSLVITAGLIAALLLALALATQLTQGKNWKSSERWVLMGMVTILVVTTVLGIFSLPVDTYRAGDERSPNFFLVAAAFMLLALFSLVCYLVPIVVNAVLGKPAIIKITVILTFSGAAGGMAYHLVEHRGNIMIPDIIRADAHAFNRVKQTEDPKKDNTEESKKDNTKANTEDLKKEEQSKIQMMRTGFQLGFLSDILIGIITANAIHLALASLIDYSQKNLEKRHTQYFTFLALGILTGYGGSKGLDTWSSQVIKRSDLENLENTLKEQAKNSEAAAIPARKEIEIPYKSLVVRLVQFEWPSDNEIKALDIYKAQIESKETTPAKAIEHTCAAAAYFFCSENTEKARFHIQLSLNTPPDNTTDDIRWPAKILGAIITIASKNPSDQWYKQAHTELNDLGKPDEERLQSGTVLRFATSVVGKLSGQHANVLDGAAEVKPEYTTGDWVKTSKYRSITTAYDLLTAANEYIEKSKTTTGPWDKQMADGITIPLIGPNDLQAFIMLLKLRSIPKEMIEQMETAEHSISDYKSQLKPLIEQALRLPLKSEDPVTPAVPATPAAP